MYAWKCWRETRARFFVFLILAVVCVAFMDETALSVKHRMAGTASSSANNNYAEASILLIPITLGIVYGIATACACVLGGTASGGEMDAGTADFLWTRPLRRSTMNWMHWGICVAEIAAVVFIPTILQLIALALTVGNDHLWTLALATPVFVFATLPVLGMITLMAALCRSANGGLIFGLGIMSGYIFLSVILQRYWGISLPDFSSPIVGWLSGMKIARPDVPVVFPWAAAVRVSVLAVGLPLAAQYVLKKAEV